MRTNLNLSKTPFSNRRLFWTGIIVVFFICLWVGLWISAEKSAVMARADEVSNRIKAQAEQFELSKQQEEEERRKREESKVVLTEDQAQEIAAARRLIAFKTLSWNRMIADIEKYVPNKVRLSNITINEVLNANSGPLARIEISATGGSVAQMTEMMSELEKSNGLFTIDQAVQDQVDTTGAPFTIVLTYNPSRGGA